MADSNPYLQTILQQQFGLLAFRDYQERVCQDLLDGCDVLLVMPTGAGKSLCYQLPAIAKKSTAIVISPLIALMEDQASRLKSYNFTAEALHSGLPKLTQRKILREYLDNKLDFLIIAPERFAVTGFAEFLARQKISLIAIDEAHCISQWGHDFRPDYRLFLQHLPKLRPAPVIAMTASATVLVQKDIIDQLQSSNLKTHIHGFWRDNIAISARYVEEDARIDALKAIFQDPDYLPAICYTNTRKQATLIAKELQTIISSTCAYHAGLDNESRKDIQTKFINNEIDIICATVAFGMGIDKANIKTIVHIGVPNSLESYYQEIGRAGRDGSEAQAIILFNEDDTRLRQYLHEKRYPKTTQLKAVLQSLAKELSIHENLNLEAWLAAQEDIRWSETCINHLVTHKAIEIQEQYVRLTDYPFDQTYLPIQEDSSRKHYEVEKFLYISDCRMQYLTNYFGENIPDKAQKKCGICDICREGLENNGETFSLFEQQILDKVVYILNESDNKTFNQLHVLLKNKIDRKTLQALLLKAKKRFTFIRQKFEVENGKWIYFVKVKLAN